VMRRATPCVLLLDLMLPYKDGWQVIEEMTVDPVLSSVPECVISATPSGLPAGVAVLKKPVQSADVRRFVASRCVARTPET
jgi:CheY-like chemotaxis protein